MVTRNSDLTRRALLDAAFEEIHKHGFQAASLRHILDQTNVTKGALYHHFPNKMALGYAVVDEILAEIVRHKWIEPLEQGNPIDGLLKTIDTEGCAVANEKFVSGDPLNSLAQEMSALDAGFRKRIAGLYTQWRNGISAALRRGQHDGCVRKDVNTGAAATFIVAAIEGCIGMAKSANDVGLLYECGAGLTQYLETLRTLSTKKTSAPRTSQKPTRRSPT